MNFGASSIVRYNCPFCIIKRGSEDTKRHLYYDPDRVFRGVRGQFVCYRCGTRGDKVMLQHYINVAPEIDNIDKKLFEFKMGVVNNETPNQELKEPECVPISPQSDEEQYLLGRGFSLSHINLYNLQAGVGRLHNRVVIPSYKDNKMVFWQARAIRKWMRAKYISPPNASRGGTIFNGDTAFKFNRIHIMEGPLNAIMGGKDCVATFGKDVSMEQIRTLIDSNVKEMIVCLDDDAFNWSLRLAERLIDKKPSLSVSVFIPPLGKDVVDIGFRAFRSIVKERSFPIRGIASVERLRIKFFEMQREDYAKQNSRGIIRS